MMILALICIPCVAIGILGLFVSARALYEVRRARRLLVQARDILALATSAVEHRYLRVVPREGKK